MDHSKLTGAIGFDPESIVNSHTPYAVEEAMYWREHPNDYLEERKKESDKWVMERDMFDYTIQAYSVDEAMVYRTDEQALAADRKARAERAEQIKAAAKGYYLGNQAPGAASQQPAQAAQQVEEYYYEDYGPRKILAKIVEPANPRLRSRPSGSAAEQNFPKGCKVVRKKVDADAPRGKVGTVVGHTVGGQVRVEFKSMFHGNEQWDMEPQSLERFAPEAPSA